ncbi:nuclear transport factor 2 family protein [Rhodococcus sp. T2V]|uniref:nuclear transport factor 2 family protein n=1 Tax=Rhodococcus sp. T2V TaxID=3034164 RepID=UPI0023E2222F|nr:nuclear transport factor 2 family protein [Rhodococcus sp. T2V]MDF3308390.1 nuclear transport factor 2 family protein [Rhodococcus sp. T2V]
MTTSPRQTVEAFLTGFRHLDVDAALSTVSDDVQVTVYPLQVFDSGKDVIRTVLDDLVTSFPDLHLTVRSVLELGQVVVAEMKIEGTQAADYVGAINQEKHLDVDSAWRFTVAGEGITGIDVYWCQNQLYRRLAVKRTDQVTIV